MSEPDHPPGATTLPQRLRNWAFVLAAIVTNAVALSTSADRSTAILLTVLISGGLIFAAWVLYYNDRQDARIKITEGERDECERQLGGVYDKLHRRDVALAILHTEASQHLSGARAKSLTRLEELLGDDGRVAMEEATRFLSRQQDEAGRRRRKT